MAGSILYPTLLSIQHDLETSEFLVNFLVAIYLMFFGIGQIGWASYSDVFRTRRKMFLASFLVYLIASVVCAVSNNIWLLYFMRIIQAFGTSADQCVGAGVISDIFIPTERGNGYGFFYSGYITGQIMGPLLGGFLTEYCGWRWVFWFSASFSGILLVLVFFCLEETFPTILDEKEEISSSASPTNTTTTKKTKTANKKTFNPFIPLTLLRLPYVTLTIFYLISLTIISYMQDILLPKNFVNNYNVNAFVVGMIYLSPTIGYLSGSLFGGRYSDFILRRGKKKKKGDSSDSVDGGGDGIDDDGKVEPEVRLQSVWLASIVPIAYTSYGWLLYNSVHISLPIIGLFIGGFTTLIGQNSTSTYLVDVSPKYSSSVTAASSCLRYVSAGVMVALSVKIDEAIGVGWTYTLISSFNVLCIIPVILVYLKGEKWRNEIDDDKKDEL